jgi:hypothetical protein
MLTQHHYLHHDRLYPSNSIGDSTLFNKHPTGAVHPLMSSFLWSDSLHIYHQYFILTHIRNGKNQVWHSRSRYCIVRHPLYDFATQRLEIWEGSKVRIPEVVHLYTTSLTPCSTYQHHLKGDCNKR